MTTSGGHVINEFIVINCTSPDIDPLNKSIHFLTNVGRHHKSLKDVISDHVERIYTTEFNVWYLTSFFHADSSKFVPVALHRKKQVKCNGNRFSFEFLDANHCAGSVMILFKGDFGTFLYTGNCRYTPEMLEYKSLKPFTKGNKELDRLYINGAFKKLGYNFPPKPVVIKQIADFIRKRKEETIYICCRQLGKEDLLAALAKQLNEVICVSSDKLKIIKKLGYPPSLFTLEAATSRIRVLPPSEVTWLKMKRRRENEKCCAIIVSGCSKSTDKEASNGIFKFAASDHSSASETQVMIERVSARAVFFLNAGVTRPRSIRTKGPFPSGGTSGSSEEPVIQFDIVNLPLVVPPPLPSVAPLPEEIEIVPPPPPPDLPPPDTHNPKVVVEPVESSDSSVRFNLNFSDDSEEVDPLPPSFVVIGKSTTVSETCTSGNIIVPDTLSIDAVSLRDLPEEITASKNSSANQLAQQPEQNSLSLHNQERRASGGNPPEDYEYSQIIVQDCHLMSDAVSEAPRVTEQHKKNEQSFPRTRRTIPRSTLKTFPINRSNSTSSEFGLSLSTIQEESCVVLSGNLSGERSKKCQKVSSRSSSKLSSLTDTRSSLHDSSDNFQNEYANNSGKESSMRKSRRHSHRSNKLSLRSSTNIQVTPAKKPLQNSSRKSLEKLQLRVPFNLKLHEFFRSSCTNVEIT